MKFPHEHCAHSKDELIALRHQYTRRKDTKEPAPTPDSWQALPRKSLFPPDVAYSKTTTLEDTNGQQTLKPARRKKAPAARQSAYTGVSWVASLNKWRVNINHGGLNKQIGLTHNEHEGARWYDEACNVRTLVAHTDRALLSRQRAGRLRTLC